MQGLVHSQVFKTKDYSQFILDSEYNRDINITNVKRIKKSIQTFGDSGECFPIVVDEKGVIIDGQHRFTARKELGLTIYYIQSTELESKKLGGINDAVSRWKSNDFSKVAKDSKLLKYINEQFIPHIPKKMKTISMVLKHFSISKNILLIESDKSELRYNVLITKCPKLIVYLNILETNMLDFNNGGLRENTIFQLGLKLVRYNVPHNEIIKGTYAEIMSDLYKRNLVK